MSSRTGNLEFCFFTILVGSRSEFLACLMAYYFCDIEWDTKCKEAGESGHERPMPNLSGIRKL